MVALADSGEAFREAGESEPFAGGAFPQRRQAEAVISEIRALHRITMRTDSRTLAEGSHRWGDRRPPRAVTRRSRI